MADKRVIIDGVQMMHGTSIKGSRDTNVNTITTFDEVIPQGTRNTSHSIDMSKVSYEDATTYAELDEVLTDMLDIPAMVTIEEDYFVGDEEYTVRYNYFNCLLDGDDYEIKPEEHTVLNLKFKASRLEKEIVDYQGE